MPCNRFAEAEGRASLLQVQQQGHREVEQLLRQVGMHPAGAQCLAFSAYLASLSISSPETAQFCTTVFYLTSLSHFHFVALVATRTGSGPP